MIKSIIVTLLLFLVLIPAAPINAQPIFQSVAPEDTSLVGKPVVYLDVEATSWRSRGRVSFGIIPSLKNKLAAAGFAVTRDPDHPHDLTLIVRYDEKRARQISLNLYGTDIHCTLSLEHSKQGRVFALVIDEVPDYAELVTAPYIEVVDKFQANPYFHFIGEFVRDQVVAPPRNASESLIMALERTMYPASVVATPMDTLVSLAETFPNLDEHFASVARERAIDELGRLGDPRAVDLLLKTTEHPDRRVRLHAVLALERFVSPSIVTTVSRVAESDTDVNVAPRRASAVGQNAEPLKSVVDRPHTAPTCHFY